jgi:hypothetical protein
MVSRVKAAAKTAAAHPKTPRQQVLVETRLADLLAFVAAQGSATLVEIAAAMGYARSTARTFAINLCEEGKMHRVAEPRAPSGIEYVYYAGPAPTGVAVEEDVDEHNRTALKTYPLCHRRDLWACAMFAVPAVLLGGHP